MTNTHDMLRSLLESILATEPEEIDCDEFLARLAAFFEAGAGPEALTPEFRAVATHLKTCPNCREEFDALVRLHET